MPRRWGGAGGGNGFFKKIGAPATELSKSKTKTPLVFQRPQFQCILGFISKEDGLSTARIVTVGASKKGADGLCGTKPLRARGELLLPAGAPIA